MPAVPSISLTCFRIGTDSCLNSGCIQVFLLWIHLAPVCGTASRARDIRRFHNDPKPLRSEEWPEGLPGLSPKELERVSLANRLFEGCM